MKSIDLQDYQRSNVFYRFYPEDKSLLKNNSNELPRKISGYVSFKKKKLAGKANFLVACYYDDNFLTIVMGNKIHHCKDKLEILLSNRIFFSLYRKFTVILNDVVVDELKYISISNSSEEWPDDYVDLCKFMKNLPLECKKSLREQLVSASVNTSGNH